MNGEGESLRAKWPSRDAENRLEPECWPSLKPGFVLNARDPIFTIGSCFARNIERRLHERGFDVPAIRFCDDLASGSQERGTEILNKYTPPSILQELLWTRTILDRDDRVAMRDIEPSLFELPNGRFIDLQRRTFLAGGHSAEDLLGSRASIYALFRQAFTCKVVVVTLGLIECWWDSARQTFVEFNPALLRHPERFSFRRLDYNAAFDATQQAIDLLRLTGRPKILLTTSPVPLNRTFTDDDVIVANMYSKSVLRAVSGAIADANDEVDYIPTYETVMLTRKAEIWQHDLIHIQESFVGRITARIMQAYAPQAPVDAPDQERLCSEFVMLGNAGRWEEAEAIYATLGPECDPGAASEFYILAALIERWRGNKQDSGRLTEKAAAVDVPRGKRANYLFKCGRMFKAAGRSDDAQACRRRAVEDCGSDLNRFRKLGDSLRQHLNHDDADWMLRYVERSFGDDPAFAFWLAASYEKLGRPTDALRVCARAVTASCTHADLLGRFALILFRQKRSEEAVEMARRAIDCGTRDVRVLERAGTELVRLKRYDQAVPILDLHAAADPANAKAQLLLARCHVAGETWARARSAIDAVRRLEPSHPDLAALAGRVAKGLETQAGATL